MGIRSRVCQSEGTHFAHILILDLLVIRFLELLQPSSHAKEVFTKLNGAYGAENHANHLNPCHRVFSVFRMIFLIISAACLSSPSKAHLYEASVPKIVRLVEIPYITMRVYRYLVRIVYGKCPGERKRSSAMQPYLKFIS